MNINYLFEQLKQLDKDIEMLTKQRQKLNDQLEQAVTKQLSKPATPARRSSRKKSSISSAAGEVLRRHGEPLPTATLLQKLTESGVKISGKNPRHNLSSAMSRSSDFKNINGLGWWFVNQAIQNLGTDKPQTKPATPTTMSSKKKFSDTSIARAMRNKLG